MDTNRLHPGYAMQEYFSEPIFEPVSEPVFDYLDDGIMDGLMDAHETIANQTAPVCDEPQRYDGRDSEGMRPNIVDSIMLNGNYMEAMPDMMANLMYTQGFFRTQVGRNMRVEFLVGDQITSVEGKLTFVGASYILLQQMPDNKQVYCDVLGIKFASIG